MLFLIYCYLIQGRVTKRQSGGLVAPKRGAMRKSFPPTAAAGAGPGNIPQPWANGPMPLMPGPPLMGPSPQVRCSKMSPWN